MSQTEEDSTTITTYKKMFGLSNVDNTSDEDKVLNNDEIAELSNKLNLIGGTLFGTVTGTNATFTNNLILNTSNTVIKMDELLGLINTLKSQISSLSLSSNLTITPSSIFPIKIPYSLSTIDQIIDSTQGYTKSPYYYSTGSFRPFGMTNMNYSTNMFGAWSINYNTVHRNVWINNWTIVTRVWFSTEATNITIKFGEKWDRWDNNLDINSNNGDSQTFGSKTTSDKSNPAENIYVYIDYPMMGHLTTQKNSNMTTIETENLLGLRSFWMKSPDVTTNVNSNTVYGGVYIIISYDKIAITVKFCTSDGTIYYSYKTNLNPLINDRRPFQIYINRGVPIWYYGILLRNSQGNTSTDDITMFKNQFGLSY